VRPSTLRELAAQAGFALREDPYAFTSFQEFLRAFQRVCKALDRPAAFERIAREYVEDAALQGVRYAEIFVSPTVWSFFHPSLDEGECIRAIRSGLAHDAIDVALICDVTRNFGPEKALESVARFVPWQEYGVIGIGLGGDEQKFAASLFTESFALARREGLHVVAHAGEVDGPSSVRDAIELLGAERIGHGIRAVEDTNLMSLLAERRIPVEVCPTSNHRTGAWPPDQTHPLAELDAAGVLVTIDADDPAIFGCTLLDEYAFVDRMLGRDAVLRLARNGIESSFATAEQKAALLQEGSLA
jgi:adenosine deaminase